MKRLLCAVFGHEWGLWGSPFGYYPWWHSRRYCLCCGIHVDKDWLRSTTPPAGNFAPAGYTVLRSQP